MCRLRNIALERVTEKCDRWTDGQTDGWTDEGQSDPYVSLCFAGDTIKKHSNLVHTVITVFTHFDLDLSH